MTVYASANNAGEGPLSLDDMSKPAVRTGLRVLLHYKLFAHDCKKKVQ